MDLTVTYQDERAQAALLVHAADSRLEFQRWRLRSKAQSSNGNFTGEQSWLHAYAWPDMAACLTGDLTIDGAVQHFDRGHPLPFETYLALPEPLTIELEDALYELNPQWVVRAEPADSEKKEVTSSTGA